MKNALQKLVTIQKEGKAVGIYSACSANPFVIEAVLKKGLEDNSCVLIESTGHRKSGQPEWRLHWHDTKRLQRLCL